ncbi:hypothetical protein Z043_118817 [Scleropages formosus]|uniref:Reticulon n=1 Tax=Scleropages formosus TaxID=113540 RepID=A0A0P7U640_SCLFO|nr:hypothetical protein Z043_118817 [Scleropages formosus]
MVRDLVYWREPKKSGVVFGVSLLVLLSLATFSVISVVSYLLLALLCVTIAFRTYKSVVQAVQKSDEGHPFKALLDKDIGIPTETFRKHTDVCLSRVNRALKQMRRLFLVEDLVDSLKVCRRSGPEGVAETPVGKRALGGSGVSVRARAPCFSVRVRSTQSPEQRSSVREGKGAKWLPRPSCDCERATRALNVAIAESKEAFSPDRVRMLRMEHEREARGLRWQRPAPLRPHRFGR